MWLNFNVGNKMKSFLFLLFLLKDTNAYFQLVNKAVQGNYKYYNKYVSYSDLKQEALLSFYKNQHSCSEDELEKIMYKETRNYCYREMTIRKKNIPLSENFYSQHLNYDYSLPKSFHVHQDLQNHEKIIIAMLLQNKSNLEIMDRLQCSFQRYKKYIHKLRNRFK
jgi:DNA-binding CsgD family transcriptional regulator